MIEQLTDGYDEVVVGGGPAGLNGALMQARARCTVEAHRVRLAVGAGSRDG